MSIEVCNESGVSVDEEAISSVARFALDALRVNPLAELSVLLVELETMTELHQRWLELPGPTDVMSFPMDELDATRRPDSLDDPESILGDIVLCPEFARAQAGKAGHGLAAELHLLTVHGVLHLLGYDHAEPDQEREMFGLQNQLLERWRDDRERARVRARQRAADSHVLGTAGLDGAGPDGADPDGADPDGADPDGSGSGGARPSSDRPSSDRPSSDRPSTDPPAR